MSAKSRDSADSLDSEIVFDLSDEVKLRWIQFISVKLTVALGIPTVLQPYVQSD